MSFHGFAINLHRSRKQEDMSSCGNRNMPLIRLVLPITCENKYDLPPKEYFGPIPPNSEELSGTLRAVILNETSLKLFPTFSLRGKPHGLSIFQFPNNLHMTPI